MPAHLAPAVAWSFPPLVQCANCHLFVHMNCYGVAEPPNGKLWLCDVCALGLSAPPPCVLCPGEGWGGYWEGASATGGCLQ